MAVERALFAEIIEIRPSDPIDPIIGRLRASGRGGDLLPSVFLRFPSRNAEFPCSVASSTRRCRVVSSSARIAQLVHETILRIRKRDESLDENRFYALSAITARF